MARIKLTKSDINKAFEEALSGHPAQGQERTVLPDVADRIKEIVEMEKGAKAQ